MKLSTILASTFVVAGAAFMLTPAADARTVTGKIKGYSAQVVESGSYQAPDFITINGPRGQEKITVTCSPFDWQSYGPNTATWTDGIARAWCF